MKKWPAFCGFRAEFCILPVLAAVLCSELAIGQAIADESARLPRGAIQRLGTTRYRHPGRGKQLHFVANSTQVVICSENHGPQIFDVPTGRRLRNAAPGANGRSLLSAGRNGEIAILTTRLDLVGGGHPVDFRLRRGKRGTAFTWTEPPSRRTRRMACSPDGKLVVTVTSLGHLKVREVRSGEIISQSRIGAAGIECIDWSADGRWIAFATRHRVILWDYAKSNADPERITEPGQRGGDSLRFSNDSSLLAVANIFGDTVELFNVVEQAKVGEIATAKKSNHRDSLCFSPDDQRLYIPNLHEQCVDVYDVNTAARVDRFDAGSVSPRVVTISGDGSLLVAAGDETAFVAWDMASKERISDRAMGHRSAPAVMKFSDDGQLLASGDVAGTVRVWKVSSRKIVASAQHKQPKRGTSSVLALAFSPDNRLLASCGQDDSIQILNIETDAPTKTLQGHGRGGGTPTTDLIFSPDGQQLLSFGSDDKIRRWQVGNDLPLPPVAIPYKSNYECRFDRNCRQLCLRTTRGVFVYDVQTGKEAGPFLANQPKTSRNILLPDAGLIVGSSRDTRRAANIRALGPIAGPGPVAAGNALRWTQFREIRAWATTTQTRRPGTITRLSASGNDQWLAVCFEEASTDSPSRITIFDVESRQPHHELNSTGVQNMSLSPDGRFLATSYPDTSILVWEVAKLRAAGQ